jgi:predicted RNA-binding Zn-ribbon protein involved in translation (DUF1610 family)
MTSQPPDSRGPACTADSARPAGIAGLYTRCPNCGFISPPSSGDYARDTAGGIDWTLRVTVRCTVCHALHSPALDDVLPLDDTQDCSRCGASAPCPSGAAIVSCPQCGLLLTGRRLAPGQREELRTAEARAGAALRNRWLAAKDAARQAGTLPPFLDTPGGPQ